MEEDGVGAPHVRAAIAALAIAAALAACSKHEASGPSRSDEPTVSAPDTQGAAARIWREYAAVLERQRIEAKLVGHQIGRDDSLIEANRAALAEWVAMWRVADPNFELDSLWCMESYTYVPEWIPDSLGGDLEYSHMPREEVEWLLEHTYASPSGRFEVRFSGWGDADMDLHLRDTKNGRAQILMLGVGAGQQPRWVRWLDERTFLLTGIAAEFTGPDQDRGWISIQTTDDRERYARYITPPRPVEDVRGFVRRLEHRSAR